MDYTVDQFGQDEPINETSPSVKEDVRYAGFWMRFWAYLIDGLVLFSLRGILFVPLKFINDGVPFNIGFWTLNELLSASLFILYFVIMTKMYGQTVGKIVFGLKVVRKDFQALKWSDVFFREFIGRSIHAIFKVGMLLYIAVGFTPEKEGIHDMIADTRVIHKE